LTFSGHRKEGIAPGTRLALEIKVEMTFGVSLPDKARVNCGVKITEGSEVLGLDMRTVSLFSFSESFSQEEVPHIAPEMASHGYAYAAHMTSLFTRELGLSSPVTLPAFDAGSFQPSDVSATSRSEDGPPDDDARPE
jgi:hypothetical protein